MYAARYCLGVTAISPKAAVYCLAVAQTLVWAALFYSFPAMLLRWETELGWSKTELTAAFSAAAAVSALVSPVAGRMIDLGRGPLLLTGCSALGGVMLVVLAQCDTYATFFVCWVVIGAAMGGSLYEPCFSLITRTSGHDAQRSITLVTLFAGFAGTISFPLGHYVGELAGWRGALYVYAAIALAIVVPLMWVGSSRLERMYAGVDLTKLSQPPSTANRYGFLRRPAFWLLAASFALLTINHGIIINHLLPLLKDRSIPPETAVLAASMIGPMQVFGRIVMMLVEKHSSVRAMSLAVYASLGLGTVMLIGSATWPWLLAAFVLFHGFAAGVQSIMKPMSTRELLGAENFGLKYGSMTMPVYCGFAFAPYAGSLIWAYGGYSLVLNCVLGCAVVGFLLYWATIFDRS